MGPVGEDILPRARKTQAALAYLCLAQGERVPRGRLAGIVWDRSAEAQARDSLRHALSELSRGGHWRIEMDHDSVRLDTTGCWIDAFEAPDRPELLLDNLYGISSAFDQWLIGERIRFENRWQAILDRELEELATRGAAPELRAAAARKLLNFIPTHEAALRHLMTAFVEMDDRAQAIREYERFRLAFTASLGMPPSEATLNLYEAIRIDARVKARNHGMVEPPALLPGPAEGSRRAEAPAVGLTRGFEPSIAVLPFRNLSGDGGRDHVAEGLAEDLVEALSRVPGLFVISRLSAAAYRSQERPPNEIGLALGARYIVSGSVRLNDNRLRLVVELIDTKSGAALWTSRFDEHFSDLLEMQDRLAETVVRSIAPHLRYAELQRTRIKRPEHQDAYDLLLRAQERMHNPSREVFESADPLFRLATERPPRYAAALAWWAYWHVMRVGQGWSSDDAADTEAADRLAKEAVLCDATEPMAYAVQGHVAAYLRRDFDMAFACFETALQMNPNSARAWLWNANAHAWIGEGARAVDKVNRAMALSPYDPLVCAYSGGAAIAYLADGQYDRAVEFALRCIRDNRGYTAAYKLLILGLSLSGREGEARTPLHQLLLLEPKFSVEHYRNRFPGRDGPLAAPFCDALARAGVPHSS
ncbi:MAG: BTAD domain-containing putative transcriptional regulator [Thiohalocapsa sp.]